VIDTQLAHGAALSRSIIIGAILIGLVLTGITLVVARSVTKPIGDLIGAMQEAAVGNFKIVLPGLGRSDEIGQLAIAFNNMVSELAAAREQEIVEQARTGAIQTELTRVARLTTMGQMAASFAHEINQPLAAIVANGDAGLRWLANPRPDLEEARAALTLMVEEGHRASDIVGGICALFRKGDHGKAAVDVNELIREMLRLLRADLHTGRVSVRAELLNELPNVLANRVQLQLVSVI
jgi:C4-dicarboxylate-specific signal transduction histidine kinase